LISRKTCEVIASRYKHKLTAGLAVIGALHLAANIRRVLELTSGLITRFDPWVGSFLSLRAHLADWLCQWSCSLWWEYSGVAFTPRSRPSMAELLMVQQICLSPTLKTASPSDHARTPDLAAIERHRDYLAAQLTGFLTGDGLISAILRRHSASESCGPETKVPLTLVEYQPDMTPRRSDSSVFTCRGERFCMGAFIGNSIEMRIDVSIARNERWCRSTLIRELGKVCEYRCDKIAVMGISGSEFGRIQV